MPSEPIVLNRAECTICGKIWDKIKDGSRHTDCVGYLICKIVERDITIEKLEGRILKLKRL